MSRTMMAAWLTGLLLTGMAAPAADWTQFRGEKRTGVASETGWNADWQKTPPKTLWTWNGGETYAMTLVAGDRVYVTGSDAKTDSVYCLNAETGKEIWKVTFPHGRRQYIPDQRSNALISTPLLNGKTLYVVMREGELYSLNAANGKTNWHVNLLTATGAKMPHFGVSSSPILEGSLLLFNLGKGGAALDSKTGKVVWKTEGESGYASPVVYSRSGKREVALFGAKDVMGADAQTGKELWRLNWKIGAFSAPSGDPIFFDGNLLCYSDTSGARLLKWSGATPTPVWESRSFNSDFSNAVLVNGSVYGNNRNKLACIDWQTGKTQWEEKGLGQGSLIAADNKLLILTERGDLVAAEATPAKYRELGRIKLFDGKDFMGSAGYIAPTLAGGRLYCRNTTGKLVCLDLRMP